MVKGKTPRLDGVVVILFLHHWHVIGNDGFEMINEPIGEGSLPACMTKRLITLLHKQIQMYRLGNWRGPITLLHMTYKSLESLYKIGCNLFIVIISPDQLANFLLLRYILNNVLFTYESLA